LTPISFVLAGPEEVAIREPEADAAAYARITDLATHALNAGDFNEALRFARGAHLLSPTSAHDLGNLAKVHLFRRDYDKAAAWFERVLASGVFDPIAIRFVTFASAQSGNTRRFTFWAERLHALGAALPPSPEARYLTLLAHIVTGYATWGKDLSAPPPISFFDEDNESQDQRYLRKALLGCAQGLLQRALQFISTLAAMAGEGALRAVAYRDVELLQARRGCPR